MSNKRERESFGDDQEVTKKMMMKFFDEDDHVSPSAALSDDHDHVKQEEGVLDQYLPASTSLIDDDNRGSCFTPPPEKKSRIKDFSCGSVLASSTRDQDPQSASCSSSTDRECLVVPTGAGTSTPHVVPPPTPTVNKQGPGILFNKILVEDDFHKGWLQIPLNKGKKFIEEPKRLAAIYNGTDLLEFLDLKDGTKWLMHAVFVEGTDTYFVTSNWDNYVSRHGLEPGDEIIISQNPTVNTYEGYGLDYRKKVCPAALLSSSKTEETPKVKLMPLHWDKVRASSDREMVRDQLKSSSFKLDSDSMETNRVLDTKKSQNIAILLRELNVTTEEVCEALLEGNADTLGTELLESLLKMAPTKEEERKLKEFKDDSPVKLGSAERFLKAVLDIPFAFKRVDAMLYITNFESEVEYLKKCFETLEAACEELRSSRMFLKLLEAVLKTGNRMNVGTNRGDAHAFKLDTLPKLVDVKGADGKTTLLHFVVQKIIRAEGAARPLCSSTNNQTPKSTPHEQAKCRKLLRLQVVSGLSSELNNVKKAAAMDSDVLSNDVSKLSRGIGNIRKVVRFNQAVGLVESSQKFCESMNSFMKMAKEEIKRIQALESVALSLVNKTTEYFLGIPAKEEEGHPFRIFLLVRDFLTNLDRVCKEVGMMNE